MIKDFLKKNSKSSGVTHVTNLNGEFIGMEVYRDKLFVATKDNIYFLNKHNKLEVVKFEANND